MATTTQTLSDYDLLSLFSSLAPETQSTLLSEEPQLGQTFREFLKKRADKIKQATEAKKKKKKTEEEKEADRKKKDADKKRKEEEKIKTERSDERKKTEDWNAEYYNVREEVRDSILKELDNSKSAMEFDPDPEPNDPEYNKKLALDVKKASLRVARADAYAIAARLNLVHKVFLAYDQYMREPNANQEGWLNIFNGWNVRPSWSTMQRWRSALDLYYEYPRIRYITRDITWLKDNHHRMKEMIERTPEEKAFWKMKDLPSFKWQLGNYKYIEKMDDVEVDIEGLSMKD